MTRRSGWAAAGPLTWMFAFLTATDYGVTGCGKKLVYKFVPGVGIVANTAQADPGSAKAGVGAS